MAIRAYDILHIEQQEKAFGGWREHYQQMSCGVFRNRVVQLELDGVQVFQERINTRVEQYFHAPADALSFCFDHCEQALYVLNGDSENTWITPRDYAETGLVFSGGFLARAGAMNIHALDGLFMTPLRSSHCPLFARWVGGLLSNLLSTQNDATHGNLASQLLEDCFFVAESAAARLEGSTRKRVPIGRRIVRCAVELVNAHPEELFNSLQLATAASVSVRQLQKAFLDFTGVTPSAWLKLRRLNAARRDLASAHPRLTVAEVAMRWGFWHLGRFSREYRQLFQELPSQTVARHPSG